jgi:hypothetical protein
MGTWYSTKHITYTPPGPQRNLFGIVLTQLDTGSLKDQLASKINARLAVPVDPRLGDVHPPGVEAPGNMLDVPAWELNDHDDHEYNSQMAPRSVTSPWGSKVWPSGALSSQRRRRPRAPRGAW